MKKKTKTMDDTEAARMCEVDVQAFLNEMKGKLALTSEDNKAAKARVRAIKLDSETQKILEPALEIVVQAAIWDSRNELKRMWIQGRFMQVAENVFSYRRVKGGITGGIRGVLKALGWSKSQAYRAKDLVETFEDGLLAMPTGISAAKLLALIEKQKQEKKRGKIFDPVTWLDDHKHAVRDSKNCDAVKEMLGIAKEKKSPKTKTVETHVEAGSDLEEITVANISARVKRSDETGLTDVVLKSLSDTQVDGLKRWLNAQEYLEDATQSVPRWDTLDAEPVQQEPNEDEVPDTFKYLLGRVTAKTGEDWAGENPPWKIWNLFGWTNDVIDAAMDNWDELELEEKKPELPDLEYILEYSADVVKAAKKIILETGSKTTNGAQTDEQYPVWEARSCKSSNVIINAHGA